jgi:hypothetical protein
MFLYLMEDGVSGEEWSLRGKVLYLHDATQKLRLFKSIGATDQYKALKQIAAELREEIRNAPTYAPGADPDRARTVSRRPTFDLETRWPEYKLFRRDVRLPVKPSTYFADLILRNGCALGLSDTR